MSKKVSAFIVAGLMAGVVSVSQAQTESDVVGALALGSTPIAALAPLPSAVITGEMAGGMGIHAQYGHMSGEAGSGSANIGALGLHFGNATQAFALSAGYEHLCSGCDGVMMAGATAGRNLVAYPMGATSHLRVGVEGNLGFGTTKPSDIPGADRTNAIAASVGAPVSVAISSGNLHFSPFVTPSYGYGRLSAGGASESGQRFMLGGGVAVSGLMPGLGLDVGFNKMFLDGAKTLLGLNLSWQM